MDFQNEDEESKIFDFFKENQNHMGDDEDFDNSSKFPTRTQRSIGFNEYIEFQDPSIKG